MGNEIALLLPLAILVIIGIAYFFTRKIEFKIEYNEHIFTLILLAIPIVILTIFILRPSGWIESFNQAPLSFGEQRPTTRIFYLFILIAILSYSVVIYYNLFLLLLRKISWRELNEKKIKILIY